MSIMYMCNKDSKPDTFFSAFSAFSSLALFMKCIQLSLYVSECTEFSRRYLTCSYKTEEHHFWLTLVLTSRAEVCTSETLDVFIIIS